MQRIAVSILSDAGQVLPVFLLFPLFNLLLSFQHLVLHVLLMDKRQLSLLPARLSSLLNGEKHRTQLGQPSALDGSHTLHVLLKKKYKRDALISKLIL
jgi:hypothetical protein